MIATDDFSVADCTAHCTHLVQSPREAFQIGVCLLEWEIANIGSHYSRACLLWCLSCASRTCLSFVLITLSF